MYIMLPGIAGNATATYQIQNMVSSSLNNGHDL